MDNLIFNFNQEQNIQRGQSTSPRRESWPTPIEWISPLSKMGCFNRSQEKQECNERIKKGKKRLEYDSKGSETIVSNAPKKKLNISIIEIPVKEYPSQTVMIVSSVFMKTNDSNQKSNSLIFGLDLEHPPLLSNLQEFFQIRDQVKAIFQLCLSKELLSHELENWIKMVVLHVSWKHSKKMAELGLLLYFLERGKTINYHQGLSLITLRTDEIIEELKNLKSKKINNQKIAFELPLGFFHYVCRIMGSMAISCHPLTRIPQLNVGALYAIMDMFIDPKAGIARDLKPEFLMHILIVTNSLIQNPQCKRMIEQDISLHVDMSQVVSLELKEPYEKQCFSSVDIMRACIIALYFDLRQGITPNCYAIAPLIALLQAKPDKILEFMLDWLAKGHIAFNDNMTIPLWPLLKKRLENANGLEERLSVSETNEMTIFEHVSRMLNLNPLNSDEKLNKDELDLPPKIIETLQSQSQSGEKEHLIDNALHIIDGFKESPIIKMLLVGFEFLVTHQPIPENTIDEFSMKKNELIEAILTPFHKVRVQKANKKQWNVFCNNLKERVGQTFWFEDSSEHNLAVKKNKLLMGPLHKQSIVTNLNKKELSNLEGVYKEARYLFLLEKDQCVPVRTFTRFREEMKKLVNDNIQSKQWEEAITNQAHAILDDEKFIDPLVRLCAKQTKLTQAKIKEKNLLLLKQSGGFADQLLQRGLNIPLIKSTVKIDIRKKNAIKNFLKVLQKILQLPKDSSHLLPVLPAQNIDHVFTIDRNRCRWLLNKDENVEFKIKEMFKTAKKYLAQQISEEKQQRVLAYISTIKKLSNKIKKSFCKAKTTYFKFRELILSNQKKLKVSKIELENIIDQEFSQVILTNNLFNFVMNKIPETETIHFKEKIKLLLEKFPNNSAYPYEIAYQLRKLLIDFKLLVTDPALLEHQILGQAGLPLNCDLIDPNYRDEDVGNKESPYHTRHIIRIHLGRTKLEFFQREKKIEIPLETDSYKEIDIIQFI